MRYRKGSYEYANNYEALREMEETIPMTLSERVQLRKWVKNGHDIDSNPWEYYESDGENICFLKALRIRFGAAHGPWDNWENELPWILDENGRDLIQL